MYHLVQKKACGEYKTGMYHLVQKKACGDRFFFQNLTIQSAGVTMKVRSRLPKVSIRFPLP